MNKEIYIDELQSRLHSLPSEERDAAISYYQEYLNDAGPQGEMRAIEELGSPAKVANQILAEFASSTIKRDYTDPDSGKKRSTKKRFSQFAAIIAGIIAAPVAFPLILAAVLTLLAAAIAVAALVFSIYITCAAFIGSGGLLAIASVYYIFTEFSTGLVVMGTAGILMGLGIMLLVPARFVYSLLSKAVLRGSSRVFYRMKGEVLQ